MSIAVDQSRLRHIVETILGDQSLSRAEVMTILELVQLAAGVDPDVDPSEHAILQAIAQRVSAIAGVGMGELQPIPRVSRGDARRSGLRMLADQLESRRARELAYAFTFLVSVADVKLTPQETASLEEFQHALGLDYSRATDLVVFLTEVVAGDNR